MSRLLYGQRDEPYTVLARLGNRLEGTLAPEETLSIIVTTITEALKLPYAAIALRQEDTFSVAAERGESVDDLLTLPLPYAGEAVGELHVAPRGAGERFSKADLRLLGDLARQAGTAIHAVQLTMNLQRTREQLILAREEERRRLRNDLHDGIGPRLASLNLKIETARNRLAHEPLAGTLLAEFSMKAEDIENYLSQLGQELLKRGILTVTFYPMRGKVIAK
jgi:signal transduction histidine kinase